MSQVLNVDFHCIDKLTVHFGEKQSALLNFESPFTELDYGAIHWYFEVYATGYTTSADEKQAQDTVVNQLPEWGSRLFNAVFQEPVAQRLYQDFQQQGGLLTISAQHPAILSLPWELLYDPKKAFLFGCQPPISIRRCLRRTDKARQPAAIEPKQRLRVLFVNSWPVGSGLIDPRANAQAVLNALDALDDEVSARFEVEFLRPPTLEHLTKRLECDAQYSKLPPVDILHFDGHSLFKATEADVQTACADKRATDEKKGGSDEGLMGHLLFEDTDEQGHPVDVETLGNLLTQHNVSLVTLSGCQSATMGWDEAASRVAAQLLQTGMPAVLVMTCTAWVETARRLFATVYELLAHGAGIGEALDEARRTLYHHPERGEQQRSDGPVTLKMSDWFLPVLYQAGADRPLLLEKNSEPVVKVQPFASNLPELQQAGFVGRKTALWTIERALVRDVRRLTISGFEGQGKTYLAIEAGHWLCQTGLFEAVCFVDYASFRGVDAVELAVSTLAAMLETRLTDVAAATAALQKQPTLLILDNLEAIETDALQALLDVAEQWSETGQSRVLLTTRAPDFQHAAYPTEGSLRHQALPLSGLTENEALDYFQRLLKLPPSPSVVELPERKTVLNLFRQVAFHPLSVSLLSRQLKKQQSAELGMQLETFIAKTPDNLLLASLNLFVDNLDEQMQDWLLKLAMFQRGAFDDDLLQATELTEEQWQALCTVLESTGLIHTELLPRVEAPYIRFHPSLAPALRTRLNSEEQNQLLARHQACYYQSSDYLCNEYFECPEPICAIVHRDLPNLLYAVKNTLAAKADNAADFVEKLDGFLEVFELSRERAILNQQAEQIIGEQQEQTEYTIQSNKGQQLFEQGDYQAAAQVFNALLPSLGEQPSYERCVTLSFLGQCYHFQGQPMRAEQLYRQGLTIALELGPYQSVKRQKGALLKYLADALRDRWNYGEAEEVYELALRAMKELNDQRSIGVINGQLGVLALQQDKQQEAIERYHDALAIFQRLEEAEMEALVHYKLGMVHQEAEQWEAAAQAYQQSALLSESQGNLEEAAEVWNDVALVNNSAGHFEVAEAWFRKAIEGGKIVGDDISVSKTLNNLANLLQINYPHRLPEAQQLAKEALAIKEGLAPEAAEMWKTYALLAVIAKKQNDTTEVTKYNRLLLEETFADTQDKLEQLQPLIAMIVAAVNDAQMKQQLEPLLEQVLVGKKKTELLSAIRRIFEGERDENALWESLDMGDSVIIRAILQKIEQAAETVQPQQ